MEYLGVSIDLKHMPKLDPGFIPFGVWREAYLKGAAIPIAIAVERNDGKITVWRTRIHGTEAFARAGVRILAAAGCDTLVFGAETPDTALLQKAARVLCSEDYRAALRQQLAAGARSFAAARQVAHGGQGIQQRLHGCFRSAPTRGRISPPCWTSPTIILP